MRSLKRNGSIALTLASLLVLGMVGTAAINTYELDDTGYATTAAEYELLAGQDEPAGKVYVWDAFGDVYVQYVAKHGWCILETHVEVAADAADIPQNRGGPIPGQFSQGETFDDCVTLAGHYVFEDAVAADGAVVVAAHAVVQKTTVIDAAPYFADTVVDDDQGVQVDLNPIPAERSNPVAALEQEYPNSPRDDLGFFSLGFKHDETTGFAEAGGSVEVSFECPIANGEGPDLRIWEVTFGTYPEEKAEVFAWDGAEWVFLGIADNSEQGPQGSPEALTVSDFDLGSVGLMSTEKIKVVDITDPELFDGTIGQRRANADGFDLDGIQALQDCTEVQTETAWADGTRFVERGNWATYATYKQGEGTLVDTSGRELTFLVFDLGDSSEDLGGMAWVDGPQKYVAHTVCAEVAGDSAWFTYQIPEAAQSAPGAWVTFKVTADEEVGYVYSYDKDAMVARCTGRDSTISGGWAETDTGSVIVHPGTGS